MTVAEVTMLVVGGFAAGALNVAAAGGSLLSFLMLTMLGVPPLAANATNLAATPASFLAGVGSAWRTRRKFSPSVPGFLGAILGTVTGVGLVNSVTPELFRRAAPVLLVIAAAALVVHPWVRPIIIKRRERLPAARSRPWVLAGWLFCSSVYAGAFGGGVGVLVLLVFTFTTSWPWKVANGAKNMICLVTSLVGLAAFSMSGLVLWPLAVLLGVSMAAGGLLGHWLTARLPDDVLRIGVAMLTAFGAGHMAAT